MKTSSVRGFEVGAGICSWNWRLIAVLVLVVGLGSRAIADRFQLVSALDPSQGPPAGGSGDSAAPVMSADGRYVLFASTANNLGPAGTSNPIPARLPPKLNIFLRDRTNGMTALVSVNLTGTAGGNGDSLPVAVSTNGRYALFESSASDLVPGDTNNAADIFVRDLVNGTTLLVSVSTNGGVANDASRGSVMTPDGRHVAFVSAATNLVPGDTNGIPDVFVRDLQAGVTVLASAEAIATNYPYPTSSSEAPDIAPDGRYVAFYSTATNLVPGVTTAGDIYVRDLVSGTTTWASAGARAALQSVGRSANAVCYNHALSADGQFVAYEVSPKQGESDSGSGVILRYNLGTGLTDLVHTDAAVATATYEDIRSLDMTPDGRFIAFVANYGGLGGITCIRLWDTQTGGTTLVSGNLSNAVSTGSSCDWPTLDSSGRFVAFLSSATNMVTNTVVGDYHLYLRDTLLARTILLDKDTNDVGSGVSSASAPRLNTDGRFVAFECLDANLVPGDRNRDYDVFMRDVQAGATELISAREASLPSLTPNGPSLLSTLSVSTNGRYVAFASEADNLVPNDTNGCRDIFVRDVLLGTNILVSTGTNGIAADGPSTDPSISGDGRCVAFTSSADNLVAGDSNRASDVFVRDLQSGTTLLVSANTNGSGPGNNASSSPVISADGRFVFYRSQALNLAAGSFYSGYENLFVRDLALGTNYALTHTTSGTPVGAMSLGGRFIAFFGQRTPYPAALCLWDSQSARVVYSNSALVVTSVLASPDGNRLAYVTSAGPSLYALDRAANTNCVVANMPSTSRPGLRFSADGRFLTYVAQLGSPVTNRVYLYDFQTGTNLLVSQSFNPLVQTEDVSDSPDISGDGRFVAYRSAATNVVPGDSNGVPDVFLYDRLNGMTTLMSVSRFANTTANSRSLVPVFSADGQTLLSQSWASDLVEQDLNHYSDVLAYSLHPAGQIPVFSATIVGGGGAGQGPWILWPVVAGKTYQVEFKNSLDESTWQACSGGVVIQGNQGCFNDASAGTGLRFYRVVAY